MAYSSIQQNLCKHEGCSDMPTMGMGGYCYIHEKEDAGYERKVKERERKAALRNLNKKGLRQAQGNVPRGTSIELDEKVLKEKWFRLIRTKLTGTCQCGCANKSQKNDDMYFRHSCCHIFPKSKFFSIKYHPLNYVERAFFGGCHGVMDDTSMDRWVNMADWEDIKAKFYELAPLLTNEERSSKFYNHLEILVYNN